MEERSVRVVVSAIILCIIVFACVVIFLIVKKISSNKKVETTTVATQIIKLVCNKWNNTDIKKYHEYILEYNYGELYKLNVLYQYTYNYSFDKDEIRNDLKAILKTEREKFSTGVTGKFETTKEGGNTTITYDLTDSSIRMYVNSYYYHNNMYLNTDDLSEYMKKNGYNCILDPTK